MSVVGAIGGFESRTYKAHTSRNGFQRNSAAPGLLAGPVTKADRPVEIGCWCSSYDHPVLSCRYSIAAWWTWTWRWGTTLSYPKTRCLTTSGSSSIKPGRTTTKSWYDYNMPQGACVTGSMYHSVGGVYEAGLASEAWRSRRGFHSRVLASVSSVVGCIALHEGFGWFP